MNRYRKMFQQGFSVRSLDNPDEFQDYLEGKVPEEPMEEIPEEEISEETGES